ncbi:MAG: hypothetical protein IT250_05575 [Chitinophagaceae bacterium]|nr:hypothetical protein [Chitinophagaceae bacterium]
MENKDVWQETTDMDDLTLKELTEMACNSSYEQIMAEYEESLEEKPEEPPNPF